MTDKTAKRILLLVPSIALFLAGRVGHGLVSSVFALFEFAAFSNMHMLVIILVNYI